MSRKTVPPRTAEQLEADMELAFREGDIGLTALRAWECFARFPKKSVAARIYTKKILRDPYVVGLSLDAFKENAKALREADKPEDLAKLSALGLLRFPAQRYLSLSLVDAGQSLGEQEWKRPAIEALGDPAGDDVVLLNAVASLENESGQYEKAYRLFQKLRALQPQSETVVQNLSASLVGLGRFDEAVLLLEEYLPESEEPMKYILRLVPLYRLAGFDVEQKIAELDERVFAACSNVAKARVHVDLQLFLQNTAGMVVGLECMLEYEWDAATAFELAAVELAQNRLAKGLNRYGVRFEAYPGLVWYQSDVAKYTGQILTDEVVCVWAEQGIGDEVMFSMFFDELAQRVRNVIVAADSRLHRAFSIRYPHWQFLDRHAMPDEMPTVDYACPMGDLMVMFLPVLIGRGKKIKQPILEPDPARLEKIASQLKDRSKPRVAITWRGGEGVDGQIRSMDLGQLLAGLPKNQDIDVISLQYDDGHEQELIEFGDRRVASSGLDNRWDLEGVFALLRCCDAVVTVDNAVAHFAVALGVPTAVLIPAAQIQFRWKNRAMKELLFPGACLFVQEKPCDWAAPVEAAWQYTLRQIGASEASGAASC